jgi:glutamate dehydrogenase (NAD(P)+)
MKIEYQIQNEKFVTAIDPATNQFAVKSQPRTYTVDFVKDSNKFKWLADDIAQQSKPLILVDKYVKNTLLSHLDLDQYPCYEVEAVETNKDITNVLEVSKKHSVDMRTAAFVVAVGRVAQAFELRGSLV